MRCDEIDDNEKVTLIIETHRHRNIGSFLRCGVAFGATKIFIVGSPLVATHGAHGAQRHVEVVHFYYLDECLDHLRAINWKIVAISPFAEQSHISECQSQPVHDVDLGNRIAFLVGQTTGLSEEIISKVDDVVHVKFTDMAMQEMIPYDAKVGICLESYLSRLQLPHSDFIEGKFTTNPFEKKKGFSIARNLAQRSTSNGEVIDEMLHEDCLFEMFDDSDMSSPKK